MTVFTSSSGMRVAIYFRGVDVSQLLKLRLEEIARRNAEDHMKCIAANVKRGNLDLIQSLELYRFFKDDDFVSKFIV